MGQCIAGWISLWKKVSGTYQHRDGAVDWFTELQLLLPKADGLYK
jgi:hypothetical protein